MSTDRALEAAPPPSEEAASFATNLDALSRSFTDASLEATGLRRAADLIRRLDSERPKTAAEHAIAAGDGTLHGAIDYWQDRATKAEANYAAMAKSAFFSSRDAARYSWLRKRMQNLGLSAIGTGASFTRVRRWGFHTKHLKLGTIDQVVDRGIDEDINSEMATLGGHEHHNNP